MTTFNLARPLKFWQLVIFLFGENETSERDANLEPDAMVENVISFFIPAVNMSRENEGLLQSNEDLKSVQKEAIYSKIL